jgi:tRNA threonylcarbamoyladenosine biosynthesis protein TsaB
MRYMRGFSIDPRPVAGSPTILALDATAGSCSVALLHADRCEQVMEPLGPSHSRRVLAMVAELLERRGLDPPQIDAIGFGAGPGSFTGLRVACGVAQGLGFGWRRPLVPVDSMATLAWQACERVDVEWVLVAIDARMGEVYRAAWRRSALRLEPALAAAARAPALAAVEFEALPRMSRRTAIAGDGFAACQALAAWARAAAPPVEAPDQARRPAATAVARLAARAFADGLAVDPADAAPVYVRDKVALDVDEQAALRARRAAPEPL